MITVPLDRQLLTPRLSLRCRTLADNQMIYAATQHPGFNDGMPWDPPHGIDELTPKFHQALEKWKRGEAFTFVIDRAGEALGLISIRKAGTDKIWSVGFFLHPDHQGQGYMGEALAAVLRFGFETLKAMQVEAQCAHWNQASEKILLKAGMQFSTHIPRGFQKNGNWVAEKKYTLIPEQVEKAKDEHR
jgi:ribosomal-protein-alanine N-acetyltransferase